MGIASKSSSPTCPSETSRTRSAASGTRSRRTTDLRRQRHRPGQPALGGLRDQHRVAHPRARRARPARLDPTALPRRRPRTCGAQTASLLPFPRSWRDHPERTTRPATRRGELALARPAHRRVRVNAFAPYPRVDRPVPHAESARLGRTRPEHPQHHENTPPSTQPHAITPPPTTPPTLRPHPRRSNTLTERSGLIDVRPP